MSCSTLQVLLLRRSWGSCHVMYVITVRWVWLYKHHFVIATTYWPWKIMEACWFQGDPHSRALHSTLHKLLVCSTWPTSSVWSSDGIDNHHFSLISCWLSPAFNAHRCAEHCGSRRDGLWGAGMLEGRHLLSIQAELDMLELDVLWCTHRYTGVIIIKQHQIVSGGPPTCHWVFD